MKPPAHGGNLAWAATIAGCPPSAILDFSASISPLGPPNSVQAAIQSHFSDLTAYPDPAYLELRDTLAEAHGLSRDWILPGNGSAELLTWASWDLSQLAETFLITPAFGDYRRALNAFNVKTIQCPFPQPLRTDVADTDLGEILAPLIATQKLNRAGLLLNNPHNPSGQIFQKQTILPYLEQFALVVVDEAFMDFLPPDQQQQYSLVGLVPDCPNLIVLRSLTKFYSLPGLRLGYCIAHPDRLQIWQQRRDPWPVNVLAAAASIAAVRDQQFQHKTWDWLPPARAALWQGLAKLPGLSPGAGAANFLLVQSLQPISSLQQTLLEKYQILIRDCLSFPELGENYFRVAVRTFADNQRLLKALGEILN